MRVVPGLYMADCTQGGRAWLLADGITCVLFDTGGPDGTLGVGELLQSAGRQPHEVRVILVTHAHRGHAGNAAGVRELTGASLAASAATASAIADPPPPPRRRFPWLFPSEAVHPAHVDRVVEPGEVLDIAGGIEVVDAPGHSAGGLAFHLRGVDALIVGDSLRVGHTGVGLPPPRSCEDPAEAARTAARLGGRPARVIAPGHGFALVAGRLPIPSITHIGWTQALGRLRRR